MGEPPVARIGGRAEPGLRPVFAEERRILGVRASSWPGIIAPVVIGILALTAWELTVRLKGIPHYILPGPLLIAQTLWNDWVLPRRLVLRRGVGTRAVIVGSIRRSAPGGHPVAIQEITLDHYQAGDVYNFKLGILTYDKLGSDPDADKAKTPGGSDG